MNTNALGAAVCVFLICALVLTIRAYLRRLTGGHRKKRDGRR